MLNVQTAQLQYAFDTHRSLQKFLNSKHVSVHSDSHRKPSKLVNLNKVVFSRPMNTNRKGKNRKFQGTSPSNDDAAQHFMNRVGWASPTVMQAPAQHTYPAHTHNAHFCLHICKKSTKRSNFPRPPSFTLFKWQGKYRMLLAVRQEL